MGLSGTTVIVGSGMAAMGADAKLRAEGVSSTLYDADDRPGGHTKTHVYRSAEGRWEFDEGPHVSFTKDSRVQELLAEAVGGDFNLLPAVVDNYWRGYRFKHPAICNLHGLPADLVVSCITDFVTSADEPRGEVANYEEWLTATYGKTFAETFPMEYAKKVHTTEAKMLGTDWLGPRLYRPSLEEVLRGAVTADTADVHYVTEYRYPAQGGFESYLKPFHAQADIRSGHRVVRIDPSQKSIHFAHGAVITYEKLITTIPLRELVHMLVGAPPEIVAAAQKLACTSMVLVNVGVDREDVGETWTYFYDDDIVFTRLSYPSSFSPKAAPPGCGSFQAEVYFSDKYQPLDRQPDSFIEVVLNDLKRTGLMTDSDRVLHQSALFVPHANIIHDHDKLPALELIMPFLDEIGIITCGRYGLWGYQWTDEAFLSGEAAAEQILGR